MSTRVLEALPGKLDIKRHSPSILYVQADNPWYNYDMCPASFPHVCSYSLVLVNTPYSFCIETQLLVREFFYAPCA